MSFNIKEIKMKITMTCHSFPVRMPDSLQMDNTKCAGMWNAGDNASVQPLAKMAWQFFEIKLLLSNFLV